jgi:hypothetical protein
LGIEDRKQARLKEQARLICDFSAKYKASGQFDDFFAKHNMGIPLALALDMGMVTGVQGIGEINIEETYEDMVRDIFGNDPNQFFNSIDDMVRQVSLDELGLTEDDAEDLGWTKEA